MAQATSLSMGRFFTKAGKRAYDHLVWESRESRIDNPTSGKVVFEQKTWNLRKDGRKMPLILLPKSISPEHLIQKSAKVRSNNSLTG